MITQIINNLKKDLKKREQEILDLRFGLQGEKQSLAKISARYGITRERVRQIQEKIINNLQRKITTLVDIKPILRIFKKSFEETNNFRDLNSLFTKFQEKYSLADDEKPYLYLLLHLLPDIEKIKEDEFHRLFFVTKVKADKVKKFFHYLSEYFQNKKLSWSDFVIELKKEFKKKLDEELKERTIEEILSISHHLWLNPFNDAGHINSFFIAPKNVKHKILVLFHYYRRPLHFKEIYEELSRLTQKYHHLIHDSWQESPDIATVHNELIRHPEFVLTGRGIYALKEWGYSGLFVKDLILEILKKNKKPMPKEKIFEEVLKQKLVKPQTIQAMLYQLKEKNKIKFLPNNLISL